MNPRSILPSCLLAAAAAPFALAQTGPWFDGELLVRTVLQPSGALAIVRADPMSGGAAVLATPQYWGGWSGSMVFDAHRGGVLANVSFPPDNTFLYRLWLVDHDGSRAAMPGFTGSLRALASAGDGRVFFIRHTGPSQGPKPIEYFDANDQIQILLQADGVTPFQFEAEHLLYHAASNALIASTSKGWSVSQCGGAGPSVFRIPLSADGSRVVGATTCVDVESHGYGEIMGLDLLPSGNVLATTATGWPGAPRDVISIHPVTLAVTTLVEPNQADIDAGVWSAPLGRVLLHTSNPQGQSGLYAYEVGSSSTWGTFIPTSIPLAGSGGFSPAETMIEVDVNGPACDGFQVAYGAGLAGSSAITPLIGAIGCPDLGSTFTLSITGVMGGAPGLLAVGGTPIALPVFGGTMLVLPAATLPIAVGGPAGVPGAGSLAVPVTFTDPAMVGVDLFLQAAFLDLGAPQGVSMTRGLRLQAG